MIKAEHIQEVSKRSGKPYEFIRLIITIGGKEIELKKVFLEYQEQKLLKMAD